jgi:hypothetical protein
MSIGAKTQSIRDQPERLKKLVDLCAQAQRHDEKIDVRSPLPKSKTERLLNGVTDQTARAQLQSIVYERDRLQTEIKALRPAFARLSPISNLTEEGRCGPIS